MMEPIMAATPISPQAFATRRQQQGNLRLIDVRSPGEFASVHAVGAENIPLDRLDPARLGGDEPLFVICKSGGRSSKACQTLTAAGRANVFDVEGGTDAWIAASLEVVRGKGTISIERQVRIAAGAMVFAGVLLGTLVSPWFLILSGFVGCGLMFAGITDWCGMGMLLAKMPWNTRTSASSS
jgi:rhodanese-related sulfurtransferase